MTSDSSYSITKVSQMTGLKAHTLRFYEKEGIIHPKRTDNGIRYFSGEDLDRLSIICCLKKTGMPLKDIKAYFELVEQGDSTLEQRLQMFEERKRHVLQEIEELKFHLETVNWKIEYTTDLLRKRDVNQPTEKNGTSSL